jgi:hypothetical protein
MTTDIHINIYIRYHYQAVSSSKTNSIDWIKCAESIIGTFKFAISTMIKLLCTIIFQIHNHNKLYIQNTSSSRLPNLLHPQIQSMETYRYIYVYLTLNMCFKFVKSYMLCVTCTQVPSDFIIQASVVDLNSTTLFGDIFIDGQNLFIKSCLKAL